MKAFVTSIGEKTTEICCQQLEKFGFEVVRLSAKQSWPAKYRQFINCTDEDCFRVDADVLVNENILEMLELAQNSDYLMIQGSCFDFYQNNVWKGQPVFYRKEVFPMIQRHLAEMNESRPETWGWRLPHVDPRTHTFEKVVGMHGFFAGKEAAERAKEIKIRRGQIAKYDFDLVEKLYKL